MKIHKSWEILAAIAILALTALILALIVGCPVPVSVCSPFDSDRDRLPVAIGLTARHRMPAHYGFLSQPRTTMENYHG